MLLTECTHYYSKSIAEIRDYLTPSFLAQISNANEDTAVLMHSTNPNLAYMVPHNVFWYKKEFKECSNYNLTVYLYVRPNTPLLTDIALSIKTYRIFINAINESVYITKESESTKKSFHYVPINSAKIKELAKMSKCPYANPFIVPHYYIAAFNELDTFLKTLINVKRKTKNR